MVAVVLGVGVGCFSLDTELGLEVAVVPDFRAEDVLGLAFGLEVDIVLLMAEGLVLETVFGLEVVAVPLTVEGLGLDTADRVLFPSEVFTTPTEVFSLPAPLAEVGSLGLALVAGFDTWDTPRVLVPFC